MNIQLWGNRVLVKVDGGEKKTNSGLILAKTEEMGDFMTGKIVAVSKGRYEHGNWVPTELRADMNVIFQYGKPIQVEGEQYMLVTEEDIILTN